MLINGLVYGSRIANKASVTVCPAVNERILQIKKKIFAIIAMIYIFE
jgi:hypothetical protein